MDQFQRLAAVANGEVTVLAGLGSSDVVDSWSEPPALNVAAIVPAESGVFTLHQRLYPGSPAALDLTGGRLKLEVIGRPGQVLRSMEVFYR